MSVTTRWKLLWKRICDLYYKYGLFGIIIFVPLVAGVVWWIGIIYSVQTMTLTDVDLSGTHEISVRAPFLAFRSGNVKVLYEGNISSDAKLEVSTSRGAYIDVIPLPAGKVIGHYGGGEDWNDTLLVRYVPSGEVRGTLKITAICGRSLTDEEEEFYPKLHEQQRRK